jgi:hypothetical protein
MQTDRDIPGLFGNLQAMHDYVSFKSRGDPKILAAVPGVWRRYRRWLDQHPFRQRS